jgi:hypothetical protein
MVFIDSFDALAASLLFAGGALRLLAGRKVVPRRYQEIRVKNNRVHRKSQGRAANIIVLQTAFSY